jgi:hypothetical protein
VGLALGGGGPLGYCPKGLELIISLFNIKLSLKIPNYLIYPNLIFT